MCASITYGIQEVLNQFINFASGVAYNQIVISFAPILYAIEWLSPSTVDVVGVAVCSYFRTSGNNHHRRRHSEYLLDPVSCAFLSLSFAQSIAISASLSPLPPLHHTHIGIEKLAIDLWFLLFVTHTRRNGMYLIPDRLLFQYWVSRVLFFGFLPNVCVYV